MFARKLAGKAGTVALAAVVAPVVLAICAGAVVFTLVCAPPLKALQTR